MTRRPTFTVADALVDILEQLGAQFVFGLPGSQNTELFESLRQSDIRTVLTTSEITAGFMANGWYRATGHPGVFVSIEGPGFAWSIPPLAEAKLDSSAILLITGKPTESTHEYDLHAIGQRKIVEALGISVFDIDEPESMPNIFHKAWNELTKHGPRPVVLQISDRALSADWPHRTNDIEVIQHECVDDSAMASALSAVANAQLPILFAGAGTLEYAPELMQLVEFLGLPCLTTPTARGVIPESHPLCVSTDLFYGDISSTNALLERSDLVIALGSRFSRNGTAGFGLDLDEQKLIHVYTSRQILHERYPCRWRVQADAGTFLKSALSIVESTPRMKKTGWDATEVSEWRATLRSKQRTVETQPLWIDQGECDALFQKIRDGIPPDCIVVTDTGLHQLLTRAHLEVLSPRGLIFPSDFQSMGFGLPAAIGAALAAPDRPVMAIVGDGSFLMVGSELLTAKREKIALPVLVFCDNSLGLIRNQQIRTSGHEVSTRLETTDLSNYAKWLGIEYDLANEDLTGKIQAAFDRNTPTLIEVRLEDNPGLERARKKAILKTSLKSAIGPSATRLLRRFGQ